jgi:hypothetical protein
MLVRKETRIIPTETTIYICTCDECGKDYEFYYRSGWSSSAYCSKKCYNTHYKKINDERIKKNSKIYVERRRQRIAAETAARPDNICEYCQKSFRPKQKTAKFCSPACRQAAYRERKEGENSPTK